MLWQDGKGMEGIWRVRIDWGLMIDWGSIFDRFFGACVGDSGTRENGGGKDGLLWFGI